MSFFQIIGEINKNNPTLKQKLINIKELIQYYYRLEKGISNKSIFQSQNFNSVESKKLSNILESIDQKFIENFLTNNIKIFLRKLELKNKIEFKDKRDFLQVGMNTIFIQEPFKGLWTTGKATFYFPIDKKLKNNLTIEVFSIVPTVVIIGQERKILQKVPIKKFHTKKIQLPLNKVEDDIVELFVDVEKRWRPNIITKKELEIPMGVNIKSIMIDQD